MIKREEIDGVAVVRLAHGKVNALDLELTEAITQVFRELDGGARSGPSSSPEPAAPCGARKLGSGR